MTRPRPGVVLVDAGTGFAHPAIDLGFSALVPAAREVGIARVAYRDLDPDHLQQNTPHAQAKRLARRIAKLGFTCTLAKLDPTTLVSV